MKQSLFFVSNTKHQDLKNLYNLVLFG